MKVSNQSKLYVCIFILISLAFTLFAVTSAHYNKVRHEITELKHRSSKQSKQIRTVQNRKIKYKLNKDQAISNQAWHRLNKVMEIVSTFSDSKSFNNRKSQLKKLGYVNDSILNSDLLKSDKSMTGETYVDNSGMQSRFNQAQYFLNNTVGEVSGYIVVDQTISSKQTNSQANSQSLYQFKMDDSNNITDLKFVNSLKRR